MEKILVVTNTKDQYLNILVKSGYKAIGYSWPLSEDDLNNIKGISDCWRTVIEIDDVNFDMSLALLNVINNRNVICIVKNISDEMKHSLLQKGISDILEDCDDKILSDYLDILTFKNSDNYNKILILDGNNNRRKVLENIITRFNHIPVFVNSSADIIEKLSCNGIQYILINLGEDYKDLNEFIRKTYSNVEIRSIPIISYKDMREGVFVHEIVNGLNRLTKVILSPEELYSFLLNILFRKDVMPLLDTLNISVDYKNYSYFARETLRKIYYINEGDIFDMDNILNNDNFQKMMMMVNFFRDSLLKIRGLKWLMKNNSKNVATCGCYV